MTHKRQINRFKAKCKDIGYYTYQDTEFGHLFDFDQSFHKKMQRASHSHQRGFFRPVIKNLPEDI
ncbi:hypothetical protein HYG86_16655 [Alkalicella caledoniensis]|uniref:Uncharacterized protein n=1 Tax=Alkalicella caledoniensis TaxID=2731377 RepID=A0A7G9WC73_ALKCA|nr:hypothetical protein [Alkalicella caledoniensis]QNO16285.1 hypothetical protein HYG86_16655 [Alkalicella caledoniensis]